MNLAELYKKPTAQHKVRRLFAVALNAMCWSNQNYLFLACILSLSVLDLYVLSQAVYVSCYITLQPIA